MSSVPAERKSVLIVDDDPDVRAIIRENLEGISSNIHVQESPDGMDALLRVEKQKFNLVVTDLKMPKKNGIQFLDGLKRLRNNHRPDLVVVLSGCLSQEGFELPDGITRIPKPCTDEDLRESIAAIFPEALQPATPAQQLLLELNAIVASTVDTLRSLTPGFIEHQKPTAHFPDLPGDAEIAGIRMDGNSLGQELWLCLEKSWADGLKEALPLLTRSEAVMEACQRLSCDAQLTLNKKQVELQPTKAESLKAPLEPAPAISIPLKGPRGRAWLIVKLRTRVDFPKVDLARKGP